MDAEEWLPDGYYLHTRDYAEECWQRGDTSVTYREFSLGTTHSRAFVAVIPGGRVWGQAGCVITPNRRLLWDVSREWSDNPSTHSVFQASRLGPPSRVPGRVAVLTKIGSHNYFHWMYDVLPRLHLIQQSGIAIDRYVISARPAPFQLETLAALGVRPENLLEADEDFHVQADSLVVPALPMEEQWVCDFLRQAFLPRASDGIHGDRLYISRRACAGRRVVNEAAVLSLLQRYGFRTIQPELMTVAEQVDAFASARVIAGPQGAAFTNITFCKPGTTVIEWMCPTFFIATTELICYKVRLRYHRLMAQSRHNPTVPQDPYWSGWDNIFVDLVQLQRALNLAGVTPRPSRNSREA
ncbi:MAG: glycosyltransferase family 61 protein [Alicyclobacillus herbarius]|uniref:glycosyltransferase family 61 protein n=1 Tax=Alicyclobacillus herbarius TaxID=122960 RepID=UPI0023566C77|nr:glycosyltransferase family 61 protein [Alicyclobacillus herbarius]MCL6632759.1 glycosyltransferase family 61 protein [Alicyclobacillus herbarius]